MLAGLGLVADEGQQFWLRHWTARILRYDLDLFSRRDLLELDEIGQELADRNALANRQLRAAAFGDRELDLVGRQDTEAMRHRIDQRGIIARHDAEMVTNAITCALRQLNLDMTDRAVGRIGAALVLELVEIGRAHV